MGKKVHFFKKNLVTHLSVVYYTVIMKSCLIQNKGVDMSNLKTYHAKKQDVESKWLLVSAEGKSLGRLSTLLASKLLGKDNPRYTPGVDIAPWIVVINSDKVKPSRDDKNFYWHTGYPGGIKSETVGQRLETKSDEVILKAVERMLPKNSHGRKLLTKLRVFKGSEHTHAAQQPKDINEES